MCSLKRCFLFCFFSDFFEGVVGIWQRVGQGVGRWENERDD